MATLTNIQRTITTYKLHISRGLAGGLEMEELNETSEIIRATHLTQIEETRDEGGSLPTHTQPVISQLAENRQVCQLTVPCAFQQMLPPGCV